MRHSLTLFQLILAMCLWSLGISCGSEQNAGDSYPSIFLVKEKQAGFTSIADLRNLDSNSHQGILWKEFIQQSEKDFEIPYIDPTIDFEGRDPVHLKHENVSYDLARGISERLARSALLFVITEEPKYKDLVMRQIEALYDTTRWPMWCDDAHVREAPHVDIRTYRISMWVALCYNWMHDYLSASEKQFIIEGLDQRAIQPFWEKLAQRPGWYRHRHNWFTNMFGGMGITAMALGDAHPESQRLLDTIVPEMIAFNEVFGEMGEFNEPPGYAGAVRFSVEFAEAYRCYTRNARNLLTEKPFPEVCYWILYHTLPPGRMMTFGDTNTDQPLSSPAVIAAVANANQDGMLQDYYLNYFTEMKSPMELFWFNPSLVATPPEGKLPLGIAYREYGAELISRSSWDPVSTPSVVYGKAGRETNHDDNDVGQLCIDGYGEALIIDPGKPKPIYPKDYFSSSQYNYYTRSSTGHNVLVIGGKEMISEPNKTARGTCLASSFRDSLGSSWKLDVSPVYENASRVIRRVAHLFPGIVAVHDYAELQQAESIDLRWHCIQPPLWDQRGSFTVQGEQAMISGKVIALDDQQLTFSSGNQSFQPPYHLTRQGDPLDQHYEPFLKVSTRGTSCSILTLFSVSEKEAEVPVWQKTDSGFAIERPEGKYEVRIAAGEIELVSPEGNRLILE